jgi:sterol desaturase/sphingolipid hydroxylase (fatty acid hydroxylase superfamily)
LEYRLNLLAFLGSVGVLALAAAIAFPLERIRPAQPDLPFSEVLMDYKVVLVNATLGWLLGPLAQACGAAIINAAGGGFIELRIDGWWVVPSSIAFILVYDLYLYWAHRLSHIRPLWAIHSLHHSAEAMTLVSGGRHHWLESLVLTAFFPVVPIIFKVPLPLLAITSLIYGVPCTLLHINYRLSIGPLVTWINNPQWHRIHHSTQPEHFDKNFCTLFPLMDIIFGTAWIPAKGEFPPATGLVPSERPTVLGSIFWPIRRHLKRWTRNPRLLAP